MSRQYAEKVQRHAKRPENADPEPTTKKLGSAATKSAVAQENINNIDEVLAEETAPEISKEELDALLAEIDDVLETGAQAFVDAFVQKGGQ